MGEGRGMSCSGEVSVVTMVSCGRTETSLETVAAT